MMPQRAPSHFHFMLPILRSSLESSSLGSTPSTSKLFPCQAPWWSGATLIVIAVPYYTCEKRPRSLCPLSSHSRCDLKWRGGEPAEPPPDAEHRPSRSQKQPARDGRRRQGGARRTHGRRRSLRRGQPAQLLQHQRVAAAAPAARERGGGQQCGGGDRADRGQPSRRLPSR